MNLSARLLIILGVSLAVLWGSTAAWQMQHLQTEVRHALDQRLAASARMVAGLMSQMPPNARAGFEIPSSPTMVPGETGIACQVSSISGEVVARTGSGPAEQLGGAPTGFSTRTIGGRDWRLYSYEEAGFRVTTADRMSKRRTLLGNILRAAGVPFIVAVIGSMLALWLGIRRGLRPLSRLRSALRERSPESLEPLDAQALPRELVPFVTTLNRLLTRVRDALARERRLTNDVAHELRTPLTAIRTHMQVARLKAGDDARNALDNADTGARRLQHTLEQLLMLARVESGQALPEPACGYVDDILRTAIHDTGREDHFTVSGDSPSCPVDAPAALAVSALRNLLDNALRFSPADKTISIQITAERSQLILRVRDHGPGVPEDQQHRLTDRFRRDGNGEGSGLGLAIVAGIAARTHGSLWFEAPASGTGLVACLALPWASQV